MTTSDKAAWWMWAAFAAGVLACLVIGWAAYVLAGYSWAQVIDYKSPYVSPTPPALLASTEPTPQPPVARRAVLVIVDGMREDVSRSMPTLNTLRSYGSDAVLTVPQPSLSFPNWTTILSGASQDISGVTSNFFTGRVPVPTLLDTARTGGDKVIVVGPTDFEQLFGVKPGPGVSLRPWPKSGYLTSQLVDDALRLSKETTAQLVVVHLPDLDEAGHDFGGASDQYRTVAGRIDADIGRLVAGLQSTDTVFVVTADHGHTDTGGHGGWEPEVVTVPAVFTGPGIRAGTTTGELQQVAPTVSVLLGLHDPAYAEAQALRSVIATNDVSAYSSDVAHHLAFDAHYIGVVKGAEPAPAELLSVGGPDAAALHARDTRLAAERNQRLAPSLAICLAVLIVVVLVGLASWRALVAGIAGVAAYYAVYETLFFVVHRYQWSLSAFNKDSLIQTFMYWRMGEAAIAALVGVAVAAALYPLLRTSPKGPQIRRYLPGYLSLGPSTLLLILSTLAVQVAWFLWYWGAKVVWILPDLRIGFKYDLDLVQMTAVGFSVVVAPVVAYLTGRYHPRVRQADD